jgi:hypothetical protein
MASFLFRVRRFPFLAALAALLFVPAARAQDYPPQQAALPPAYDDRVWSDDEIPAHLSIVEGEVTLEREGRIDAAAENIVLLAGDRLRTARGRAEVLYADGSALDLDHNSSVDLLSDTLVRLLDGRMRLSIARSEDALDYRVDTVAGSAFIRQAGDYRLTLTTARTSTPELDLVVLRGSAELANDYGRTIVRAGTHALVSPRNAPSLPFVANSASWDDFDRWVEDQRDARLGAQSTRYLPTELRYYGGAFDRYGSWDYEPSYGYVWYPAVDSSWRPYGYGRWSFVGLFGWTWVGYDRWSWPTHHYGRWGYRNRWYWIPDRRWSPAWVWWAHTPSYVSWCPLGFDNRPVISITNIHVTNVEPWRAWTVVPTRSFAANVAVSRFAVPRPALTSAQWSQFTVQRTAPIRPANVPSAAVQPLRAPTAARSLATPRPGTRAPGANTLGSRSEASSQPPAATSRRAIGSPPSIAERPDVGAQSPRALSRVPSRSPEIRTESPTPAAPARGARSRDLSAPAPRPTSPGMPSRDPSAIPDRPTPPPVRVIRPRTPEPQTPPPAIERPSSRAPGSSWMRSRPSDPAPVSPPPAVDRPSSRAPGSPWMRSRPSDPAPSASPPPSRGGSMRERVVPDRSTPPSARPSGGGWVPDRSRSAPPAARPSPPGGGGPSTAPAPSRSRGREGGPATSSSSPPPSSSRAAPRRGGGV